MFHIYRCSWYILTPSIHFSGSASSSCLFHLFVRKFVHLFCLYTNNIHDTGPRNCRVVNLDAPLVATCAQPFGLQSRTSLCPLLVVLIQCRAHSLCDRKWEKKTPSHVFSRSESKHMSVFSSEWQQLIATSKPILYLSPSHVLISHVSFVVIRLTSHLQLDVG